MRPLRIAAYVAAGLIGLIVIGFLVFVAVFADLIAPFPPNQVLLDVETNVTARPWVRFQ